MSDAMLAVLAGGAGSRMGRPKAELVVHGRPILEFLLRRWDWPGEKVLVTALGRQRPPAHEAFDREVTDAAAGEGPLRGILTALEHSGGQTIVVVATCDMPLVTRDMFMTLIEYLEHDPSLFGVVMESVNGIEPFPMALRPRVQDEVRALLQRHERSVRALAYLGQFARISGPEDESVWTNLNRPEDHARFAANFAGRG